MGYNRAVKTVVLIPAAGSGSRMGAELPKQYLPLLGKPLIHHTLARFCMHQSITQVVVVLHPADAHWSAYPHDKLQLLHNGGDTRAETVRNGLRALRAQMADDDWVLVHDAARPCLSNVLLERLLAELTNDAVGGLLAVPMADTLKREDGDGRVAATEPRAGLWRAQTPQMFRYGLLLAALEAAGTDMVTDEAQAIEFLGQRPRLVPGDNRNLKVTYPEDLAMAGLILQQEKESACSE